MRLKTFSADTQAAALSQIRRELGEDALILSTNTGRNGHGVQVVAAVEDTVEFNEPAPPDVIQDLPVDPRIGDPGGDGALLDQALAYHGLPDWLRRRLCLTGGAVTHGDGSLELGAALGGLYRFEPIGDLAGQSLMLIGPPGAGKTVTLAKLAARAAVQEVAAQMVTTDTRRAGGVEQLAAFTRLMELPLAVSGTPQELADTRAAMTGDRPVLIDTPGTNPFHHGEKAELAELIAASGAEPVLVLAAGGDVFEAAEIAEAFAGLGARRMIVTQIDLARRLGGMIMAAESARLAFSEISITPSVAQGLNRVSAVSLARILLRDPTQPETRRKQNGADV